MKISKHLHSCLLIEEQGITILIDPGNYTFENKGLNVDRISKLDYIVITHEHADHMYIPFIKKILEKFPLVQIFSNQSVKDILKTEGISVSLQENELIKIETAKHEKIFDKKIPQNIMVTLFNKLTDPGDSLSFTHSAEILALPIQAPWGSTVWAVEKALEIKPNIILPIHDWHWKDEIRSLIYNRLEKHFREYGIIFKKLQTNETIDI